MTKGSLKEALLNFADLADFANFDTLQRVQSYACVLVSNSAILIHPSESRRSLANQKKRKALENLKSSESV